MITLTFQNSIEEAEALKGILYYLHTIVAKYDVPEINFYRQYNRPIYFNSSGIGVGGNRWWSVAHYAKRIDITVGSREHESYIALQYT
jgi:hypothetical protein